MVDRNKKYHVPFSKQSEGQKAYNSEEIPGYALNKEQREYWDKREKKK